MGAYASLCDDTREDWGAAAPNGTVYTVPLSDKDQFLTHWDGGSALGLGAKDHSACLARVKAIQSFHMGASRGWTDIGYNTLTCPHGRLIEGRGVLAVGAQCPGYNRSGVGSQLMVGGSDPLPHVMLNRQRKFYDDLVGLRKEVTRKMGHRDGYGTDCPGDDAYDWVLHGMPYLGDGQPVPLPIPIPSSPAPKPSKKLVAPGPHLPFPLPSGFYFGPNDGSRYSVSGNFGRVFRGRTDRSWIQEFASQLKRRGWDVGGGRTYLSRYGNDGHWGAEYTALTKAFQRDQKLVDDGLAGFKTWRAAYENPVT